MSPKSILSYKTEIAVVGKTAVQIKLSQVGSQAKYISLSFSVILVTVNTNIELLTVTEDDIDWKEANNHIARVDSSLFDLSKG